MSNESNGKVIADQIAPELPYLRRFARAICGTQEAGDYYVLATLEAIIADNAAFDRKLAAKVALFKTFLKVWNSVPLNAHTAQQGSREALTADRRIEHITPLPRQAFLLTALEEFAPDQVASIIGRSPAEVSTLIDTASAEIANQISARVMIIEDEPLIALDIETLVTEIGHKCVGVATTHAQAVKLARETRPEIILSDIQLADRSSGIEAVADIMKTLHVPVIFITAYPERLLTGDRNEPVFLITKPFHPSMVKAVVSQALFFGNEAVSGKAR